MPYVISHQEIWTAKSFFQVDKPEKKPTILSEKDSDLQSNAFPLKLDPVLYQGLSEACHTLNHKCMPYVIRNLLRYLLDHASALLNLPNACLLYRLFLSLVSPDLINLDSIGSFHTVLTLFEVSLFNKQVIKHIKSTALIQQRARFNEYFL